MLVGDGGWSVVEPVCFCLVCGLGAKNKIQTYRQTPHHRPPTLNAPTRPPYRVEAHANARGAGLRVEEWLRQNKAVWPLVMPETAVEKVVAEPESWSKVEAELQLHQAQAGHGELPCTRAQWRYGIAILFGAKASSARD